VIRSLLFAALVTVAGICFANDAALAGLVMSMWASVTVLTSGCEDEEEDVQLEHERIFGVRR
jgi:hypothetical protein